MAGNRGKVKVLVPLLGILLVAVCAAGRAQGGAATAGETGAQVPARTHQQAGPAEDPAKVQAGDIARVEYTASLEDGALARTTLAHVAEDPSRLKAPRYEAPGVFGPEEVPAGGKGAIPGLGEAVLGMAVGERRTVTLPPEKAYGPRDPKLMARLPRAKRMPRTLDLSAPDYVARFQAFPLPGREVQLTPYFSARVVEVTERSARLEAIVENGKRFEDSFGTTVVTANDEEITLTLTPRIGAPFEMAGRTGTIAMDDGTTFFVDFNNPLAGRSIVVDVELVSLVKASTLRAEKIPWVEDQDLALAESANRDKPTVLVLYASWCGWSKKLLTETMEDPRIKAMKDRFVWAKIDSDLDKEAGKRYGQEGFPMIVLLDPKGEVVAKIDGYRDAGALAEELDKALGKRAALGQAQGG